MSVEGEAAPREIARGSAIEVFRASLILGLTSFGGPIAHLGYFRRAYVERLRWLSPEDFAGIVALCQLLPGPASSQVGFLIGLKRAGFAGALMAWLGFTLPSAILMFAVGRATGSMQGPAANAVLHGLKLTAVAVVAQAVWSMSRSLCPDKARAGIGLVALVTSLALAGAGVQILILALGAAAGAVLCRSTSALAPAPDLPVGHRAAVAALVLFGLGAMALPFALRADPHSLPQLAAAFYRAGALVFGGGHVVLPLLREALVPTGWLSDGSFLSGYGAAQAAPGPLFTFAAYVGSAAAPSPEAAILWSSTALAAIFLPGLLLAVAGVDLWTWLGRRVLARAALSGVNAAVVGVLGAALYDPIFTSAVANGRDAAVAAAGFILLERWKTPPVIIVACCVAASLAMTMAP
jgi:chromate transporter